MILAKRDTSEGFAPTLPLTRDLTVPAREALRLDGQLDASILSPAIHRLLLSMARVRNIVSSLKIENVDIDLTGARRAIETGRGKTREEQMTIRFAQEYGRINDMKPEAVPDPSIELVCNLHQELLVDAVPETALGQLKSTQNGVLDRTAGAFRFYATPPERTEAELNALFEWYSSARDQMPPAVIAGILFAEFEAIHPFHDGNGRIGRLLNLRVLKQLGFQNVALVPLDGRFFATQEKYYDTLASTNDGRTWFVWARYFTKQLHHAYRIASRRADLRPLLEQHSRRSTREVLEWVLQGDSSWFKHSDFPNPRDLSPASVTLALRALRDEGILDSRGRYRGTEYRLSTEFLRRLYSGEFLED